MPQLACEYSCGEGGAEVYVSAQHRCRREVSTHLIAFRISKNRTLRSRNVENYMSIIPALCCAKHCMYRIPLKKYTNLGARKWFCQAFVMCFLCDHPVVLLFVVPHRSIFVGAASGGGGSARAGIISFVITLRFALRVIFFFDMWRNSCVSLFAEYCVYGSQQNLAYLGCL